MASNCETTNCDMTRREALQVLVTGGMVLVSFFLAGAEAKADPQWVKAGAASEFTPGVPKKVILPGKQAVFITHQKDGKWIAVSGVCTHKGWELDWNADKKTLRLPQAWRHLQQRRRRSDGARPRAACHGVSKNNGQRRSGGRGETAGGQAI